MKDIDFVKDYFGFTTEQAKKYVKTVNKNTINLIKKSFESNAKKSFFED